MKGCGIFIFLTQQTVINWCDEESTGATMWLAAEHNSRLVLFQIVSYS